MQDLAEHLARRRAAITPPGRMRVFAAGPVPGEAQPEWSGASDADLLAAAWGAFLAEHPRGGEVLAVLSGQRPTGQSILDQPSPGFTVRVGQSVTPSPSRRREWQPVHLASLRTWRTACAGAGGGCEAWLERLAANEPAMLRVDRRAVLGALPASPAVA
nr:hypothetical protein [Planctomycetota bacterium]